MSIDASWGDDTVGEKSNDAGASGLLSSAQLGKMYPEAKVDVKSLTSEDKAGQTSNIVKSVQAASPSERRAGAQWYQRAHRQAVHLAAGAPALQEEFTPGSGPASTRRGEPQRGLSQMRENLRGGGLHEGNRPSEGAVAREAGSIAALSPAMDWSKNVRAAQELHGLSPEHVGNLRQSVADIKETAGTRRALNKAADSGTPEEHGTAYEAHRQAQAKAASSKELARGPLQGMALNNQSGDNILKAHDIHTGKVTPEAALPMGIKTGNFYSQINNPDSHDSATIDTRSADIAMGHTYPWKTPRGISSQGRYDHFVEMHRQARDQLGMKSAHQVQAVSWLQNKNAMMSATRGKSRHGDSIHDKPGV